MHREDLNAICDKFKPRFVDAGNDIQICMSMSFGHILRVGRDSGFQVGLAWGEGCRVWGLESGVWGWKIRVSGAGPRAEG